MNVQVIIPIYYPNEKFTRLLQMLIHQDCPFMQVLLIDSGNDKSYLDIIDDMNNISVMNIKPSEFNHGGTRQRGISAFPQADIYVFMTQDAIPKDEKTISKLVTAFRDKSIGCAYGRQLPHEEASGLARTARLINYPEMSYVRNFTHRNIYGIKTPFISNSFAAYRREAITEIGGFPTNTILSEDMWVCARMLIAGWQVAYVAEAQVYHSHNYTVWQEFRRYFDIGVFQSREQWIGEIFGKAEGEGKKFVFKQIRYLLKESPAELPLMFINNVFKYIGYKLGQNERYFSIKLKSKLSMNRNFWSNSI